MIPELLQKAIKGQNDLSVGITRNQHSEFLATARLSPTKKTPIASYTANEPIRGQKTSKSGRNGRICGGTLNIDNVGINKWHKN